MSTPVTRRWPSRIGPWIGIGTSPAALMTGGGMMTGMDGWRFLASVSVGAALLATIAVTQGIIGQRTRLSLTGMLARPLGFLGARYVAGSVMLVMMLGWFGVNAGAAGGATARLLASPQWVGVTVFAVVTLAITWKGVGHLSAAAVLAGLATLVLVVWGVTHVANNDGLTLTSQHTGGESIGFAQGVGLMVGFGAAFALRAPDFTADLRHRRDVVVCGVLGLAVPLATFAIIGAALYAVSGTWDIAATWEGIGAAHVGFAVIALGFVGSVMTNLHSGSLALSSVVGTRHGQGLIVVFAIGLVLAQSGLAERMLEYLTLLAVAGPGLVVVCAWSWGTRQLPERNWAPRGLTAWGASTVVGGIAALAGIGAAPLIAIAVAAVVVALPFPSEQ